jgi:serine/threonine protein kinase/dipeptidyl aminopeptidase/acylaminoacyl peptidase
MIGHTVAHYSILSKLGEGGMGIVYKAHDLKLDRLVALKFLPPGLESHEPERVRFLQEARAAATLNHPNICTIHDIQEFEGQQYIVMEYIDGRTLSELVPVTKLQDAIIYAIQICEALEEAHSKGVIHRDIKSGNIMVNTKNQVKVMDFGLAKLKGSLKISKTSSTIGTLAYMAPEQIEGEEVDARSDIFSFGIVLYEMLTGHLPFRGEHEAAMMYSIVNEQPEPLQHYLPDAPSELMHIIDRSLEKDREDRYQNVHEMLIDLRRLRKDSSRVSREKLATQTARVPSEPPVLRAGRRFQKRWTWFAGASIVIICGALAFLFFPRNARVILNPNRSFTALPVPFAQVNYGSLSKHGNWFVFPARDDSGKWDIYWTSLAGGQPSRITYEKGSRIINAQVSPDDDMVLYDRILGSGITHIRIVPMQGGLSRTLADTGIGGWWSPDAQRIGFLRTGRNGSDSRAPSASGFLEIWSMKPDGTDRRLELIDSLSRRSAPYSLCWSPDGKSIAWVRNFREGYGEVMVRELATGRVRQLTSDKKTVDEVVWASNDCILFISTKSGYSNLWAVPSGGGEEVQVTQGTVPVMSARISVDTRKLVYFQQERISHLWHSNLDGSNAHQITYDDVTFRWATFSPDGRHIAGITGNADDFERRTALCVMDRDGRNRKALTSGSEITEYCRWSPDGRWLAYDSRLPGESPDSDEVYLVSPANPGAPRLLGLGSAPEWLDSENVVITRWPKSYRCSINGGPWVQVYKDSTAGVPLSHIGQIFYYDGRKGREGYWVVAVDSSGREAGSPRRLQPVDDPHFVSPPDFRFRLSKRAGSNELWRVWLANGKEERVGTAPLEMTYLFDVSMDGKSILWAESYGRSKLALIENLFE